ncbi:MAG: RNA polymerase recycling motor HelD, partial [Paucilactobacillus nenjiangensis]
MTDSIEQYEQNHLDEVIGKIQAAAKKTEQNINTADKDVEDIGKQFNDIKINGTTYSGMVETAMSVRQQQQMLEQRETSRSHAERNLQTLTKLEKTPYFARIDFHEEGEDSDETIYIGLASFTDRPDHFLVYDWRAPISSIYYDGGLGNISYQTPDGVQEVDVKLKRQFQIADGVIVTIYDTDETVGDQMLLEALGTHSDTKMKSIVTTIQQSQNKIIRNTSAELLFVQGAAGSGKTAAVLQRIAWLLYRYRGNLNAGQVILFSPNQLFNDYINQVLPELGEHNMVQMTYFQFANRRLPNIQVQTLQQRFENDQTKTDSNITRMETSLGFFNATNRYAHHLEKEDMKFRNIMFNGKVFFSREKIEELYYSFNQNYHLSNRLDATKEELVRLLNHRVSSEIRTKWVEEEVQNLTKQEIDSLFGDQPREFDSADKEFKFLARQLVLKAFKPIKKAIDHNRWLNINAQFIHFKRVAPHLVNLEKYGLTKEDWDNHVAVNYDQLKERRLTANDVTIYLYLYDLITGKKGERDIRYVFIDEVQDYDAFQLAYLKFSFPRAKFTLLGDLNQAIFTKENSRS